MPGTRFLSTGELKLLNFLKDFVLKDLLLIGASFDLFDYNCFLNF